MKSCFFLPCASLPRAVCHVRTRVILVEPWLTAPTLYCATCSITVALPLQPSGSHVSVLAFHTTLAHLTVPFSWEWNLVHSHMHTQVSLFRTLSSLWAVKQRLHIHLNCASHFYFCFCISFTVFLSRILSCGSLRFWSLHGSAKKHFVCWATVDASFMF